MKKILVLLLMLGGMSLGAEPEVYLQKVMDFIKGESKTMILDTKLVDMDGQASSL